MVARLSWLAWFAFAVGLCACGDTSMLFPSYPVRTEPTPPSASPPPLPASPPEGELPARAFPIGRVDWTRELPGGAPPRGLALDAQGNTIVASYYVGDPLPGQLPPAKDRVPYVAKVSPQGEVQWARPLPSAVEVEHLVAGAEDGSFVVAGRAASPGFSLDQVAAPPGYFVSRLGADGRVEWARGVTFELSAVAVGRRGEVATCGQFWSSPSRQLTIWVLDASGEGRWTAASDFGQILCTAVTVAPDGSVAVATFHSNPATVSGDPFQGTGTTIARYNREGEARWFRFFPQWVRNTTQPEYLGRIDSLDAGDGVIAFGGLHRGTFGFGQETHDATSVDGVFGMLEAADGALRWVDFRVWEWPKVHALPDGELLLHLHQSTGWLARHRLVRLDRGRAIRWEVEWRSEWLFGALVATGDGGLSVAGTIEDIYDLGGGEHRASDLWLAHLPETVRADAAPGVRVQANTVRFRGVAVDARATRRFAIGNPSSEALTLRLEATGPFLVEPRTLTLGPGQSRSLDVSFAPVGVAPTSGDLTLTGRGVDATVKLEGTAIAGCSALGDPCAENRVIEGRCVRAYLDDGTACGVATCTSAPTCRAGRCVSEVPASSSCTGESVP